MIAVSGGPLDGKTIPFQGKRLRIATKPDDRGRVFGFGYVARRYTRWVDGKRLVFRVYEVDTAGPSRGFVRRRFHARSSQ